MPGALSAAQPGKSNNCICTGGVLDPLADQQWLARYWLCQPHRSAGDGAASFTLQALIGKRPLAAAVWFQKCLVNI